MRSKSEIKTRRTWKPNVQVKNYYSDILERNLRLRVTTSAIRTIDKYGGQDEYILRVNKAYLGYENSIGIRLREEMLQRVNTTLKQTEKNIDK